MTAPAPFLLRQIRPDDDADIATIIRTVMPEFGADGAGFAGAGGKMGTTVMLVFWPPRVRTSNVLFLSWATWLSRVATLCSRAFKR